jgi:hypothetical protein
MRISASNKYIQGDRILLRRRGVISRMVVGVSGESHETARAVGQQEKKEMALD